MLADCLTHTPISAELQAPQYRGRPRKEEGPLGEGGGHKRGGVGPVQSRSSTWISGTVESNIFLGMVCCPIMFLVSRTLLLQP
jgi:hypothetical protein